MDNPEQGRVFLYCAHGNIPSECPTCIARATVESQMEAGSDAYMEFKTHEVREQIAFLERESGLEVAEADLSLIQTLTNEKLQRSTFVFKLESRKAKEYFGYPTFYHFMNEPNRVPPRYEVDRVYCNSDDAEDYMHSETVFKYVDGVWKKE